MRVLVRSYQQQGDQRISTDRVLDTERLRIGRGSDQDLQIPDLRAALAHAEIVQDRRGPLLLAKTGNGVWLNGAPVENAKLEPGDVIGIGRYELTVFTAPGAALALGVEERLTQGAEVEERKASFITRLDQTVLSTRRTAWLLALLVLLCTLLIPLGLRYGTPPPTDPMQTSPRFLDDSVWLPGPVSSAHGHFADNCSACHVKAFTQVQDSACLACHKDVQAHSADPVVAAHHRFAEQRCTDCHSEHKGSDGAAMPSGEACIACHAQPQRTGGAAMPAASSFSETHPEFAPRIARFDPEIGKFSFSKQRRPVAELREDSNLHFSHALHLDPKGVAAPDGQRALQCQDCHRPDSRGVGFEPVRMETHCASCHRLDFDPDDPDRVLPHADLMEIQNVIRDYVYAKAMRGNGSGASAASTPDRRRPDAPLHRPQSAGPGIAWADARVRQTLTDVLERRTCNYCHVVERSEDVALPWRIAPVNLDEHALDHARFDHAPHRGQDCAGCHAATTSKQSTDVLLPSLTTCRECHGDGDSRHVVPSDCMMCHRFHAGGEPAPAQPPTSTEGGAPQPAR
jgi:hypothetical protein